MKTAYRFLVLLTAMWSTNVAIVGNFESFSTDSVELSKPNLTGHWHHETGAKPNAQGTLVGLAVRVYQGGQLFAEFANPSTLLREKVE